MTGQDDWTSEARERRDDVRREYKDLFEEFEALLFRHDPVGISYVNDEYAPEVGTILPRLKEVGTPRQLQAVIYEEFTRWFGETAGLNDERYEELAKDAYAAMVQHYAARGAAPSTWLWSCEPGASLAELKSALGLQSVPAAEADASAWSSRNGVMDGLAGLGFPDYFGRNWDAADESMGELMWEGYLLVIGSSPDAAQDNVARVVDLVAGRWRQPPYWWPRGPVAVVLAGWRGATVDVAWPNGRSFRHQVQHLDT